MELSDRLGSRLSRRALLLAGCYEIGRNALASPPKAWGGPQGDGPSAKGADKGPRKADLKRVGMVCPYSLVGVVNGIYYYYSLDFDEDAKGNCTYLGHEYQMTSADMLNEGCGGNSDCVLLYTGVSLKKGERFVESKSGEMLVVRGSGDNLFSYKGGHDPMQAGLSASGRLPAAFKFDHDPRRVKLIGVSDYQIRSLDYKIRLFLMLFRPPSSSGVESGPLLLAFGQELNVRKTTNDPGLARVERLGERCFRVYREEDDVYFHVLTFTKPD